MKKNVASFFGFFVKLFWNIFGSIRSFQEKKVKKDVNLNEEFLELESSVKSVTFNIVSDDVWFRNQTDTGTMRIAKGAGFKMRYAKALGDFHGIVEMTIPNYDASRVFVVYVSKEQFAEYVGKGSIVVIGYSV